jgi:tripartite-type tricarboxylate transporter receptor subunit TctC
MRGTSALTLAAGIAALLAVAPGARAADTWPSRPIHIIVPYPSGGIVDIVARAVTEQVGRDTKQAIVVEGRAGANSNIGTLLSRAAKATVTPGSSPAPPCSSIRRSTRTPAGIR